MQRKAGGGRGREQRRGEEKDTVGHILLQYVHTRQVWYEISQVLGIIAAVPNSTLEHWWNMQRARFSRKVSLCTSDELIQFDPPQLAFTFVPNKRVSMLRKLRIVNVTDHSIGFSTWSHEDNSASYIMEPYAGILPPQSTQTIMVRRTLKENETEDMQWKDKIFVWSGIVTDGVEVSDVGIYWKDEDKELPAVLTKPGESSSR